MTLWHSLAPHCQNPLPLRAVTLKLPFAPQPPPSALPSPSNSTLATSVAQLSPCEPPHPPDCKGNLIYYGPVLSLVISNLFSPESSKRTSTWLLLAPLVSIIYCTGLSDSQNTSCLPLFPLWLQLFSSATVFLASVCPYAASFPATTSPAIV